jgi:DNA-binding PadR family transcriptional regulator
MRYIDRVQNVILGLLLGGPLSLYDVRQRFERVVSLFYSASLGSIQRALGLLVERGLITVDVDAASPRGRKVHRITAAGTAAWRAWMLEPPTGSELEKTMLAKAFFLGRLDDPADRRAVVAALRARVDADHERLRELAASSPADDGSDPVLASQLATLDYGLRSVALARTWLHDLERAVAP